MCWRLWVPPLVLQTPGLAQLNLVVVRRLRMGAPSAPPPQRDQIYKRVEETIKEVHLSERTEGENAAQDDDKTLLDGRRNPQYAAGGRAGVDARFASDLHGAENDLGEGGKKGDERTTEKYNQTNLFLRIGNCRFQTKVMGTTAKAISDMAACQPTPTAR